MMRQKIALVVDDQQDICEFIQEALEDYDITVWTCSTAEEAVERAAYYVIDVCFIDIFMPGKGGLWLIDECQSCHPIPQPWMSPWNKQECRSFVVIINFIHSW